MNPLLSALEAGERAFGPSSLDLAAFEDEARARVVRRLARAGLAPTPERVEQALARIAAADLYLALACERNFAGAWECLSRDVIPRVRARLLRGGAVRADEIVDELLGELAPGTGTASGLAQYDGAGSLVSWLTVIALRRMVARARVRTPASIDAEPEAGRARADPPAAASDPSELAIAAETTERFADVIREVWRELTDKERLVVLWKYRDGLKQREAARLLAVGEPRVSRLLERALAKIRRAVDLSYSDVDRRTLAEGLWSALRDESGDCPQDPARPRILHSEDEEE